MLLSELKFRVSSANFLQSASLLLAGFPLLLQDIRARFDPAIVDSSAAARDHAATTDILTALNSVQVGG